MNVRVLIYALTMAACAGSKKQNTVVASNPQPPQPEEVAEDEPEPQTPPKPKEWYAKAALTPVKGTKLKPFIVSLSQREDEETTAHADALNGAKPGTYWIAVHEGENCGNNGLKAGAVWAAAKDEALKVVVTKDLISQQTSKVIRWELSGDNSVLNHALALHDDKKGKPGKVLACGVVEETDEP